MTQIIFARTRYEYDSYRDFWRLVELSGFPTVYLDEIDLSADVTYISAPFNGEFFSIPKERRCKIFLWNLERPGSETVHEYGMGSLKHVHAGHIDRVLVSDKQLALHTGFHYVPLGSHPEFGTTRYDYKAHDFIHLMCYSLRRAPFFDYIAPRKDFHGMSMAPNGWGEERHTNLQRSRIMLSIHQDDHQYIEPLRFAIAAAYGLPVLSEYVSPVSSEFYFGGIFVMAQGIFNYEVTMKNILDNYDSVGREVGMVLHKRLTEEFTFRRCLEMHL